MPYYNDDRDESGKKIYEKNGFVWQKIFQAQKPKLKVKYGRKECDLDRRLESLVITHRLES